MRRKEQAEDTREAVLDAADALFREKGWIATTVAAIARAARVSPETIYSRFGNKKTIAQQLIVRAMRGAEPDIPLLQQERRRKVLEATDTDEMIEAFVEDLGTLLARVSPILAVVRVAAKSDAEMAELYADLHRTRRRNLALPIEALQRIRGLRAGLEVEAATDILWSVASPELWMLRIEQGGATPESNKAWLRATLRRLLLDQSTSRFD